MHESKSARVNRSVKEGWARGVGFSLRMLRKRGTKTFSARRRCTAGKCTILRTNGRRLAPIYSRPELGGVVCAAQPRRSRAYEGRDRMLMGP